MIGLGAFNENQKMIALVRQVLNSGRLSYGPMCRQFEALFANAHGCAHGIFTNSGTSSLVASLQALKEIHGWKDGAEVIVPALTFVASVNSIIHNRLKPVLVDVDPGTYNIDVHRIKPNDDTVAIMPVHLFGLPANMLTIYDISFRNRLSIIEDSCECVLSKYGTYSVGSWGDVGCFSTYAAHHLVTGVGGVCTTNNQDLALRIRSIVNHGITTDELPHGTYYDPSHLARKFVFTSVGHSFRPTELEGALGLAQLDDLESVVEKRRENAKFLYDQLFSLSEHLELPLMDPEHSFMVFPIVLRNVPAEVMIDYLANRGVQSRRMVPLTNQPCYNFNPSDYPVSERINKYGFYIGCHQGLSRDDLSFLATTVKEFFDDQPIGECNIEGLERRWVHI